MQKSLTIKKIEARQTKNGMKLASTKLIVVLSVILIIVIGSNMFFVVPANVSNPSPSTADAASCRPCHQAITDSFIRTAHYLDSRPADARSIKGSFEEGKNRFVYNQFMEVIMIRDGRRFLQSGRVNGIETVSAPFDIVIGSCRKGQTYLT